MKNHFLDIFLCILCIDHSAKKKQDFILFLSAEVSLINKYANYKNGVSCFFAWKNDCTKIPMER